MEPQPSLERAERTAHLHPVAEVDPDLPRVVHPGDAEHDHALGFHHALEHLGPSVLGVSLVDGSERRQHLRHRLVELGLVRMSGHDVVEHLVEIRRGRHG